MRRVPSRFAGQGTIRIDMQKIDVEILTDKVELEKIQPEWQSCFDRSDAPPYLCYEWFRLYQEHFGDSTTLRVVVARIDGQVCAILPLEKVRVKIGPISEYVLQFVSDGFAPWSVGIIAKGVDQADIATACLSALQTHDHGWAFMRLSKVPSNSELAGSFRLSSMPGSVQIVLPKSWPEYLQTLPSSRRYGIRRRVKGLGKDHAVELVRVGLDTQSDASQLQRAIDAALRVSESSWQNRVAQGLAISDEKCREFFVEASERMARLNALDLSVLFLDDHLVSFLWGAARWPYTNISKLAFDPAFGKLSPGRAHIAMHIEDSIRREFSVIDFGHEFPEQKRQWSDRESSLCELWYFPTGIRSSLYRHWFRIRRAVKA